MVRRSVAITSALSFLLFLVTAVFFVRSLTWCDGVSWCRPSMLAPASYKRMSAASVSGGLFILISDPTAAEDISHGPIRSWLFGSLKNDQTADWNSLSWWFHLNVMRDEDSTSAGPVTPGGFMAIAYVPDWPFLVLFAVLPIVFIRGRLNRSWRVSPLLCPACGYDLRASTDRCPECGTPIPSVTKANA